MERTGLHRRAGPRPCVAGASLGGAGACRARRASGQHAVCSSLQPGRRAPLCSRSPAGGAQPRVPTPAAAAAADGPDAAGGGWEAWSEEEGPGPAFRDTLRMLEWPRLCEHLSKHASTALGKRLCQQLEVPVDEQTTARLLQETSAMWAVEVEFLSLLDYGGIGTADAEGAIKRAAKGGMVAAKQLRGLVAMLAGADRLKRQLALVARQNNAGGRGGPLWPLLEATARVAVPQGLMRDVGSAIGEDGEVADAASEQVRMARAKVRGIAGRINSALKGFPGEPSEKGGRLCVAAPAGTRITGGVMLGSSVGGGMVFIEPPQVVSLNNDLSAARAEAMAAEEAVLWDLSGRLMGVLEDVEAAFHAVGWLDLLSAKVRFGLALGGVLPRLTPWEAVFQRRSGSELDKRRGQGQGQGEGAAAAVNWDSGASAGAAAGAAVHLRQLRHPLLLADHLERRQQLERLLRASSGGAAGPAGGGGGGDGGRGGRQISSRMLGTRREVVDRRLGRGGDGGVAPQGGAAGGGGEQRGLEEELAALAPPRPIDLVVSPETSVVVITGPNTGGKTAAVKALGLSACMAKAGLLLPAQAPARLPCYSSVLADIGDEQSLTASLSTFSGHIRRISALRAEADGRSLLLLDELGTGTDPTEGAALGLALLKQLIKGGLGNGALTFATTHHSSMTSLKFDDPRAENASVEFDEEAMAPTYRLLWGVPGRSNALNIAARLGLEPAIVSAARARLSAGVAAANEAIEQLEQLQDELREADLAAFAVEAGVAEGKKRLADIKQLVLSGQQRLALRRSQAIREVQGAAKALLRALRQERKARAKGNAQSRVGRQLDRAMGDDLASPPSSQRQRQRQGPGAAAAATQLDAAVESFWALTGAGGSAAASRGVPQRQHAAAGAQQWQEEEEQWVLEWGALLSKARRTLAAALEAGGGGAAEAAADAAAADGAELERELEELAACAADREAREAAQLAAAQRLVDDHFRQLTGGEGKSEGDGEGGEAAVPPPRARRSVEEQVSEELFAAGVGLVERALDEDESVQQMLQRQQAAAAAAEAQRAKEQARQREEQAAVVAALERELDAWEPGEQLAEEEEEEQQQQQQQPPTIDLDAVRALEELMLGLEDDASGSITATSSSSGSDSSSSKNGSSSSKNGRSSSSSSKNGSSNASNTAATQQEQRQQEQHPLVGGFSAADAFDDLMGMLGSLDAPLPPPQQQQQQQRQQQQQ